LGKKTSIGIGQPLTSCKQEGIREGEKDVWIVIVNETVKVFYSELAHCGNINEILFHCVTG
jgi:hypothetical protein